MRAATIAAVLLLGACGSTLSGGTPSPSTSPAAPLSSPAPTGTLPGAAVHITVNGTPYIQGGAEVQLTPTGAPVVVVMAFPFAVDRPSLERWLPMTTARVVWTDDRTVQLTYPESEQNLSFKAPETRSADGTATVDIFYVRIAFPSTHVIDLFTLAELRAINTTGVRTAAAAYRVAFASGLTVSPDGRRAIAFDAIRPPAQPSAPAIVDLASRRTTPLAQPPVADGPFAFADWLPDGRLLIVGRGVWIGAGDGSAMRLIADSFTAAGGLPWTAVPNPVGDRVAIWAYNSDGHIAIVDLRDGTVRRIAGPFRRYAADGQVSLAWSRDGTLLAGVDADSEEGSTKARLRIVDVATDRTVRTIEGGAMWVTSFPTGELVLSRDSGERGAGGRLLGLVIGFDGVEHHRYLGCAWAMSLDLRYVLQNECGGAGYSGHSLIDVTTGASIGFGVPSAFRRWLSDGRLAFY